jgi:hypothetical protein
MVSNLLANQEQACEFVLRQNVTLTIVDFDDVRHITRVDVNGFTRELRNGRCPTIVGVVEIPDVWVYGPVVNVDTEITLQLEVLGTRRHLLLKFRVTILCTLHYEEVLLVGDQARRENTDVWVLTDVDGRCPLLIVEEVVQSDLILNETLPFVEPFVADHVPNIALTLEGMTCFFGFYHEFTFELSPILDCLDFGAGGLIRPVNQILVERQRDELEASVADDLAARLPLAAPGAEPVVIVFDQLLD